MTSTSQQKDRTIVFNRVMYGLFIIVGIYFLLAHPQDWSSGLANLAIALIFDPFDPKVSWEARPRYQRIWLFFHLAIIGTLSLIFFL